MATTRLGQLGVGVESYAGFKPKRSSRQITRLTQAGIGGARYLGFVAKAAAQPEQPEQPQSAGEIRRLRFAIRPDPIVGDAAAILPALLGRAAGSVGVAGRGRVAFRQLVGQAEGHAVVAGNVTAAINRLAAAAEADHGNVGDSQARLRLQSAAIGTFGPVGDGDAALPMLSARSRGTHQADELIAMLLAA